MKRQVFLEKAVILHGLLLLLLIPLNTLSQTPTVGDCLGAIPVCQDVYYEPNIYSGTGNYPTEIPICSPCQSCCPNNNCLDGEWNSAWYMFTVQESGMLSFLIQPDVTSDDYDWAVYNLTDNRCEDIYAMASTLQSSCNAAGISNTTGMSSASGGAVHCNVCGTTGTNKYNADLMVLAGQTYVLYVSNWGSGASGGFTLDFSASTAVIYDDVPPSIATVHAEQVSGCSETELDISFSENVTCSGVAPSLFTIEGPGGPYQVTDVYGAACDVGGEWEKDFTLTVDHPFSSNGTYTLYMLMGFPGVQDPCNNIAPPDTITFVLDLGAPEVDETGLVIVDETCGLVNGSITGLDVTGQTDLTYIWKNSQGAIVGNTVDLVNIPAEAYTLEVHDLNDCVTYAGPFTVDELGVPEIDDDGITITPSNYGASNGSIVGIVVNTIYTIDSYIWTDDIGSTVGTNLDLTDVPSGYYDLTVIDVNGCEAHAGPYFVSEIGGPLSANPSASPEVICYGDATTLSPGAGGGSGNYTYQWSSDPAGFSSTLENPVVTPAATTVYTVEVFDGYISSYGDVTVIVQPLPLPNAGTDQTIPHGTSTILDGSASLGSGDYAYSWTPIDKLVDATVQNPSTKNIYQTTQFYLEIEDNMTGCKSETPDEVIVNIAGGMLGGNPTSFPDSVFCIGETIWLYANAGGGSGSYTFQWTSHPPLSLPDESSFSIEIYEPDVYTFYVNINDGYNDAVDSVTVVVDPVPVIDLGAPVQTYCLFDTVTLDAGNPGSAYLWSNGDTNQKILVGTTGLSWDSQTISVEVINAEGCESDTTITIVFDYEACLGISEHFSKLDVRVFPNPTTGHISVAIAECDGNVTLKVYDMLGGTRMEDILECNENGSIRKDLDLSFLPAGIYLLKLQDNNSLNVTEVILK